MRDSDDTWDRLIEKVKPRDKAFIPHRGEDITHATMGQYAKSQALKLATPMPHPTFLERIYYAGKRAVLSCMPESYFFNRRYAA